jgi:putative membrane protein
MSYHLDPGRHVGIQDCLIESPGALFAKHSCATLRRTPLSAPSMSPVVTGALFAFLHHIAAFVLFSALFAELVLLRQALTAAIARSLLRMDAVYGASAGVLIIVGLIRVYYTEKGADYYLHSGTFIAKIVLFLIIGLISIYPTRTFIGWRRMLNNNEVPALDDVQRASLRRVVHIELTLLAGLILCAALMARGVGFLG